MKKAGSFGPAFFVVAGFEFFALLFFEGEIIEHGMHIGKEYLFKSSKYPLFSGFEGRAHPSEFYPLLFLQLVLC